MTGKRKFIIALIGMIDISIIYIITKSGDFKSFVWGITAIVGVGITGNIISKFSKVKK